MPQPSITEPGNPTPSKNWPYVMTVIAIPLAAVVGAVTVIILHKASDDATLVTQILGFGATITVATLAFLKSADTHEVVNSRMDEFKRTIQLTADAAVAKALSDGRAQGREQANERTDTLAAKTDERDRQK